MVNAPMVKAMMGYVLFALVLAPLLAVVGLLFGPEQILVGLVSVLAVMLLNVRAR